MEIGGSDFMRCLPKPCLEHASASLHCGCESVVPTGGTQPQQHKPSELPMAESPIKGTWWYMNQNQRLVCGFVVHLIKTNSLVEADQTAKRFKKCWFWAEFHGTSLAAFLLFAQLVRRHWTAHGSVENKMRTWKKTMFRWHPVIYWDRLYGLHLHFACAIVFSLCISFLGCRDLFWEKPYDERLIMYCTII